MSISLPPLQLRSNQIVFFLQKNHTTNASPSSVAPKDNAIKAVMRSPLSVQTQYAHKKVPARKLEPPVAKTVQQNTSSRQEMVAEGDNVNTSESHLQAQLKKANQNVKALKKQLQETEKETNAKIENNTAALSKAIVKAVKSKEVF